MDKVTPGMLRIAIADPDAGARSRLREMIARIDGPPARVILECDSVQTLLDQAAELPLDAVFADINMPGGWSLPETEIWGAFRPDFVFMTSHGENAARAFELEAIDCLTRPVLEGRLVKTLERLWRRRRSSGTLGGAEGPTNSGALTGRQQEILLLLGETLTNKEMARILGLSHFTVRNHVMELFRLFGVSRRGDLVKAAEVLGFNAGYRRLASSTAPPTIGSRKGVMQQTQTVAGPAGSKWSCVGPGGH